MKTPLTLLALASFALAQEPSIERLDPALDELLAPDAEISKLAEGYEWTEGPVWDQSEGRLLFSDIPNNIIHSWHPENGVTVFMKPSGYTGVADYGREPGSNGLTFDAEGRLVLAEHGDRRVSLLTKDGGKMTLADQYDGKRLNSPNDIAIHSGGDIYFTDPIYGLPERENDPRRELDFCGVFRVNPQTHEVTLLTKEIERPNGIAFSEDEKTLYVANSHGPRPHIFALSVKDDGTTGEPATFFDTKGLEGRGAPDGLKVDKNGNLWATGPGGLLIISKEGKLLGRVLTHRATANIAFGGENGKTVFLTADDRILSFPRK